MPSREDLVQHDSQAEDVTSPVNPMPFATSLFRAHVGRGAFQPTDGQRLVIPDCQSKVDEKSVAGLVNQDVAGLHISMNKPLAVCMVQRFGQSDDDVNGFLHRQPTVFQLTVQITAGDQSGNDKAGNRICGTDIINRHNCRMVETRDCSRFRNLIIGVVVVTETGRYAEL